MNFLIPKRYFPFFVLFKSQIINRITSTNPQSVQALNGFFHQKYLLLLVFLLAGYVPALFSQSAPPPSYKNYRDSFAVNRSIVQSTNTNTECLGYRPDINTFSNEDIELLISLIIEYVTKDLNPNYDTVTDHPALKYEIVAIHSAYGGDASAWHSDDEMFFSWHRDYIRGLEEYLLDRGYAQFVPLPTWNPINAIPDPFLEPEAMVEEVYNTPFVYPGGFTVDMPMQQVQPDSLDMYVVDDMTCSQFPDMDEFAGFIRANEVMLDFTSHNQVHGAVNGAMTEVQTASAAAIFWLFHAYVDEIYYCYQTRCENDNVFHPSKGMVDKVVLKEDPTPVLSFDPFPDNIVSIDSSGSGNICSEVTDIDGQYSLENCSLPTGNSDIKVAPDPDPVFSNVQDGVSVGDLIQIQRHITTVYPFDYPYKYIAADVDNSGTITILDQVFIRRVILGISSQFPVDSWRYIPNYALSDNVFNTDFHNNPLTAIWDHPNGQQYSYSASQGGKSYLDALDLNMLSTDIFYENTWSFRGVKSGNVNLMEENGNLVSGATEFLYDSHSTILAGTEFSVEVVASGSQEDVYGYQFAALFDKLALEVVGFDKGELASYSRENFSTDSTGAKGIFRTLWYGSGVHEEPAYFSLSSSETSLFKIVFKAKKKIFSLEDVINLSEEALSPYFFDNDGNTHPVTLKLIVEPGTPPKHLLHNLFPNPASNNQITFEVQSSEVVPITLKLQDQFGQFVTVNSTTSIGIQGYTFSQFSALQNGVLFYQITAGSEVMTGYIIKQ